MMHDDRPMIVYFNSFYLLCLVFCFLGRRLMYHYLNQNPHNDIHLASTQSVSIYSGAQVYTVSFFQLQK